MNFNRILTLLLLGLFCQSCATFDSRQLAPVYQKEFRYDTSHQTRIFQKWSTKSDFDDPVVDASIRGIYEKFLADAISRNECCVLVDSRSEADIIVEGVGYAESKQGALLAALITGATLYVIPSWVTEDIKIDVEVSRGQHKKKFQLNDHYTLVQWLPLIFAAPFTDSPKVARDKVVARVFDNLLLRMQKDRLLLSH